MKVRFRKLHPDAKVPTYATPQSAGADLYATERVYIDVGRSAKVQTSLAAELPPGVVGLVCPRSGLAAKHGVTVLNAPGVIDSDYRGSIAVLLVNHGDSVFTVDPGERIAQLVLVPAVQAAFEEAEELAESERGESGWGSSGV